MIGRKEEEAILKGLLHTGESELVSILGRRRVGKTFLIREVYKEHIVFEFTGIQDGTRRQQLDSFAFSMQQYFGRKKTAGQIGNWLEAFEILTGLLSKAKSKKKPVVFIDELPWIAGKKSDFLKGFGFFWNSWAVKNNLVVVICGSAASWMIQQVINNKGGLHNRVTRQLYLQPFKCKEVKLFLQQQGLKFTDDQVTELYMVFGGIPYYLKLIPKGCSVAQAINKICFAENAPLKNEFTNLYAALFANHYNHIAVIKACYTRWKGMSHNEIVKASGIPSGGTLTKVLEELEMAGFISSTAPFTNIKKEKLYRLTDEFSLFYLKFMANKKNTDWLSVSQSQPFKLWQGYAFENFCFRHIQQVKNILGIGAVITSQYAYNIKSTGNNNGHQLDLIIDRNDRCINLCEIKYYEKPFTITPQYARVLEQRVKDFKWHSGTKKTIFLTFITKAGLTNKQPLVDNEITLADFYE